MPSPPPPDDPSAEPLRKWQEEGDLDSLDQLLRIEVGVLKQMIQGRGGGAFGGSASASDIAQEAVMGLLKTGTAPRFGDPRSLRGYLWKSAWRLLLQRFERRRLRPARLDQTDAPAVSKFLDAAGSLGGLEADERALALDLALNLLSREDRELIRRVYFGGEDIATAAAATGLSRDVANMRLVRARRQLAARLADWGDLID